MPSGIATTIHFLYPLLVALIMMWVFEERSTHSVYIAIAISLCGVTLLAWGGSGGDDFYKGVALAAVTVITFALYVVGVMKSSVRNIDPVVLTLYALGISTILIIIYTITTTGVEPIRSFVAWRDILMLALVSTVVSNYTLVLAIKNIGSTMTSILSSMEPMTAIFIGVLYFDERLGVLSVAGVVLIILAVIIVVVQGRRGNL
jgi:drug/metabolite transporter (DMT)-like permease